MLNDVEQLKHLLPYDMGLAEKDCAYHSPLLTFAQLKALKNMRIRSKESEDRRRARWGGLNESYKEKRDDRKIERRERKDSVPPLRQDSYRNVGEQRSRSTSRVSSRDNSTRRPQPPLAPVRPPVTPPKTPPSQQPRFKAAPTYLKQALTTSTATPPVKAPPVLPPWSARSPSNDPPVASRTVGTSSKTPPWREHEQRQNTARGRERSQTPVERNARTRTESRSSWTSRSRPIGVPEPPPPPSRMSGSQWLNQGHREPSSSSTSYRYPGHPYQQPYHRTNPRNYNVEYAPGYQVPPNRWLQKYDGQWIDLLPQTLEQSIYFHQPRNQRRNNELFLYLPRTCRYINCQCAEFRPDNSCLPVVLIFVFGLIRFTADHKLSASCEK